MVTEVGERDLIRLRLFAHGLIGEPAEAVADVAGRMLATQAQDYAQAGWALAVRTAGATVRDVADAFASRAIVRSWPMRGTLHIVPATELNWMLRLTTPRMLARTATQRGQLELDDGTIERARDLATEALRGGRSLSRTGLTTVFEDAGIATNGQRGYYLIYHLAQTGTIVWGPPDATAQAVVLSDDWIPEPRILEHDEALATFLRGYLAGHGPATLKDFVWWSNLTVAEAKTARGAAGSAVVEIGHAGTTYLMPAGLADTAPALPASTVHALPGFDEYFLGYRDRSLVVDNAFAPRIVPGGNGVFQPTIVSRGRIVGTWRRPARAQRSEIEPQPFTSMSKREQSAFRSSAKRFARYHYA